jgi:hypothetical protein
MMANRSSNMKVVIRGGAGSIHQKNRSSLYFGANDASAAAA